MSLPTRPFRYGPVGSLFAVALGLGAGCYNATLDKTLSGVFACESSSDCPSGYDCISAVCINDEGPALAVTGPEALSGLAPGTTEVSLTIAHANLELAEPNATDSTDGLGYIEVEIDGEAVFSKDLGNAISSGGSSESVVTDPIDLPDTSPGPHRVRAQAFHLDGSPYDNPSSTAWQVFFVLREGVDGEPPPPEIAVVEPVPGSRHPLGEPIQVTVGVINWSWTDANSGGMVEGQGHSHIYLGSDDYPLCLPRCNQQFDAMFVPSTNEGAINQELTGPVTPKASAGAGDLTVAVGLQWDNHVPFPAQSLNEDEYTDALRSQLVIDEITVELYEP